ncbi:class I SAM-dependent methyltransferase [Muricauda sp. SCSIO 64092]|uniref:O-methyltransferase n=1 Tax=Allomuricauda sp. SCSIO 64092 TaxID=2908842 RepID=UPI001FF5054B|nr:class I SAM-dependent methyltransferase [Muricauda sp. SCSIO 64092]UOY06556.1 class I SAM-dependent methyltransferase [Muricauda sp. SCSIO 64092]
MDKISKHLLILKRRISQRHELNKLFQIQNKPLQQVMDAYLITKTNAHEKDDINSFSNCESYRRKLLSDNTQITYEIFSSDKKASVRDICKKAPSTKKWCQFLYHLVKNIDNPRVLEIGTNLGVSGSYILEALKGKNGKFTTMEGLPQLCEISHKQFSTIVPDSKFEIVQGLYDNTFTQIIEGKEGYDLMFIDGNHKKGPTLEYFNALKSIMGETAVFVFDDINWSTGMKEAWEVIRKDKDVNFSMDIYKQGIIIIDQNEPQKNKEFNLHLAY